MIPALLGHPLLPESAEERSMTGQASTHGSAKAAWLGPWIPKTQLQDGEEKGPRAASPAVLSCSRWQGGDGAVEAAPRNGPG